MFLSVFATAFCLLPHALDATTFFCTWAASCASLFLAASVNGVSHLSVGFLFFCFMFVIAKATLFHKGMKSKRLMTFLKANVLFAFAYTVTPSLSFGQVHRPKDSCYSATLL